jgi:two-component system sensor histidine kinase KdpD
MGSARTSPLRAGVVALIASALATASALILHAGGIGAASVLMLGVVASAAIGGIAGGLAGAVLSSLALNYFFTEPRHTFRVDKTDDVVALFVFLAAAVLVGSLLARALEERARAARRERETRLLSYLSSKLLSGEPSGKVLRDFAMALLEPFALARCQIHADAGGSARDATASGHGPEGASTVLPIVVGSTTLGTITAVRRQGLPPMSDADHQLLEACARQVGVALERARLDAQMRDARVQAETNQLRAALFSSVTHDLRTPLASIKAGVTGLLDESAQLDGGQRRELLLTVEEETDRLNRLVGNILDLARIRAGALVPAKQPLALEDVIASVLHRLGATLRKVQVRTVVHPDLPDVPADPVQIDQVLTNVLENAAHFSPLGGEVLIAARPWRGTVQVRVTDQGPGIRPEDRERVFEAFYRGEAEPERRGSGLGLAIARAVVLAHGGRIWVEGAPTGGAAVVFELPMEDRPPVAQEAQEVQETTP